MLQNEGMHEVFTPENRRTEPSRDPKSFASGSSGMQFPTCSMVRRRPNLRSLGQPLGA